MLLTLPLQTRRRLSAGVGAVWRSRHRLRLSAVLTRAAVATAASTRGLAVGPAVGAASKHPPAAVAAAAAAAAAAARAPTPAVGPIAAATARAAAADATPTTAAAAAAAAAMARAERAAAAAAKRASRNAAPPPVTPKERVRLSGEDWQLAVNALFDSIAVGLSDMAAANTGFEVRRPSPAAATAAAAGAAAATDTLAIAAGESAGTFEFSADAVTQVLTVTSPASGLHRYVYDSAEQRFVDAVDTHILIDLLSRELLLRCKGSVNF